MQLASRRPTLPRSIRERSRSSVLAAILAIAAFAQPASASSSDQVLQNNKGVVRYETGGAPAHLLMLHRAIAVGEGTVITTGSASLGTLTMPDSSVITIGQQARVEVAGFDDAYQSVRARFTIESGQIRFQIIHPHERLADYTFSTPLGALHVHGTVGKIEVGPDGVRVTILGSSYVAATFDTIDKRHVAVHGTIWLHSTNGRIEIHSLAARTPLASMRSSDKVLQNKKGVVRYETGGAPARDLAPNASIAIGNRDVASTGAMSLGSLTLADSSVILLGQLTRVEISKFDLDSNGAVASFVIYNGKTRFRVNHPAGAKANYTFQTPVGEIAVRGTIGDISVDPQDGMRLNVYAASVPVTLDTIYGQRFLLHSGEKVWVRWQNGKLVGRQTPLSQAEIDRFAEFGPPK